VTSPRDESGFTLIELMVVCVLLGIVMTVLGGIFISTLRTQQTVSSVSTSSNNAQLAARTLDTRIRNSSEFQLTTPSGSDQLLVARSASTGATLSWNCYGWYYSATNKTLRMTSTADGTKITAPSATALASWTLVASGVTPASGSVFSAAGSQLTVGFDVAATNSKSTTIQFTTAKTTGVAGSNTCF
jgi:prepilin-type N-terminal cleavage/methylation domain-containing protein